MDFNFPNSRHSVTALACSLLKYYNCTYKNNTLESADKFLEKKPKNIVLLLVDGLGYTLLKKHLPKNSFLQKHLYSPLSSVFPSTTTAAATALESGLFPSQSGWLGWNVYWKELDTNINLYPNTNENKELAADIHLGNTFLAFTPLTESIQNQGVTVKHISEDMKKTEQLSQIFDEAIFFNQEKGRHFTYIYLNHLDTLLHKYGCQAQEITEFLLQLDKSIEHMCLQSGETLFFITADHGFTDIESLYLEDFPTLQHTLVRNPSIEPRALNCFVKQGMEEEFLHEFHKATRNSYKIFTQEEVLEKELFGLKPLHPRFLSMLGDFLAVAHGTITLFPHKNYCMKATHGGMTKEELIVPLICFFTA